MLDKFKDFKERHGFTNEKIGELFGYSGSHIAAILRGDRPVSEEEAAFFAGIMDLADKGEWAPRVLAAQDLAKARQAYSFRKKKDCARYFGIEPSHWSKMESGSDEISLLSSCKIMLKLKQDGKEGVLQHSEAQGPHSVIEAVTVYGPHADHAEEPAHFERVMPVVVEGEPLWLVADVCRSIGHSNPRQAAQLIDPDDVRKVDVDPAIGPQWATNEAGLYTLLLRSNLPKAKPFKRWVTNEVLPSIRKTGSYQQGQPAQAAASDFPSWAAALFQQMGGTVIQMQQQLQTQAQQIAETRQIAQASSEVAAERVTQMLQNEALAVGAIKNWLRKTCASFIYKTLRDRGESRSYAEWIRKEFWPGIHESAKVSAFGDISTRHQAESARDWLSRYARLHSIILPPLQLPVDFEQPEQEVRVAQ